MRLTDSQVSALRNIRKCWAIREVFKVTEWRENAVYRTKSIGFVLFEPSFQPILPRDIQLHSISTSEMRKLQ